MTQRTFNVQQVCDLIQEDGESMDMDDDSDIDESIVTEANDGQSQTEPDSEEPLHSIHTSEESPIDYRPRWKSRECHRTPDSFVHREGAVLEQFEDCTTAGDFFLKFFDTDLRQHTIYQTNLYSVQKSTNIRAVTDKELLGFFGINLLMGYHKLPSWRDYWKHDEDLGLPFVSSCMSRNRFRDILSNLHFNDNHAIPNNNNDKLYKLRPLISGLNTNFAKLYDVTRNISIDESMIKFKGRSTLKQYNPMKPIKRGFKLWVRADMNGYISKFEVYQGKFGTENFVNDEKWQFGLGEKVIISLLSDVVDKNHMVYFDNYFCSVPLMEYLKTKGILACGTVRKNRKYLPNNVKSDRELKRGEFDFRVSENDIVYYKWMDNKAVHLLSNFHGSDATFVTRTQKDGSAAEFSCPSSIVDYNKYMGGVDKADMLCAIHGLNRKSLKFWHRLAFGLLDRALINAMVVYNQITGQKFSSLDFRREVAQSLITMSREPKVGRPGGSSPLSHLVKRRKVNYSVGEGIRLLNVGVHLIIFVEGRGRCEVCAKHNIESRPHSICFTCKVFLCCNKNKNCFMEFHGVSLE